MLYTIFNTKQIVHPFLFNITNYSPGVSNAISRKVNDFDINKI